MPSRPGEVFSVGEFSKWNHLYPKSPYAPFTLIPVREDWGVQWAMGTDEDGYFARIVYRRAGDRGDVRDFYATVGEKKQLSKQDFEQLQLNPKEHWRPARLMPEWAARREALVREVTAVQLKDLPKDEAAWCRELCEDLTKDTWVWRIMFE